MAKSKRTVASGEPINRAPVTHEQRNHYVEVAAYYIAEPSAVDLMATPMRTGRKQNSK